MMDPERVLELAIAEACASADRVGVCVVTTVHDGHDTKAELIQFRTGSFRVTVSSAPGSSRRTARLELDLADLLQALRRENAGRLRTTLPHDPSRGAPMWLVLAAGDDGEWIVGQTPAPGTLVGTNVFDRIFLALFAPARRSKI